MKNFCNAVLLALILGAPGVGADVDLGGGFLDHGVATPISNHRGTVATVDGQGQNVVLLWLYDCRGGYSLLMIDAQTGRCRQLPMPFATGGDGPFASILSSQNKFYTHFGRHLCEFDPARAEFTFHHRSLPQMAMSMTEDDHGRIWSATYPRSGLVSFDPRTREFTDYGYLHEENWAQYPRSVAVDDAGWVYVGIGNTACQIVAFDPQNKRATAILPEAERTKGPAEVYRNRDGKVYGHAAAGPKDGWYVLHRGQAQKIGTHKRAPKPVIADSQGLFHRSFPDGSRLLECDLVRRQLVVKNSKGEVRTLPIEYSSEGAHVMGVAAAPDGTISGGTAFPMRFFSFHPASQQWTNHPCYGQANTVVRQGDRFFVGGYGHGFLLEWDPARPWVDSVRGKADCNPRHLTECAPTINRPADLLAHPDGHTLVLAGTPGYGYTGGGLLFWDRATGEHTLLDHMALIPQHSTMSLVALDQGKLLGGTTTSAGTGGEKKATQAELYILEMANKKIEWHAVVLPGVQTYTDLCRGPKNLVFGVADQTRFFVFDPVQRKVLHEENLADRLGPVAVSQGPRVFVRGPGDAYYLLFAKRIARLDPKTYNIASLAESPVRISAGGDYLAGRIYFAGGSHVYSYQLSSP